MLSFFDDEVVDLDAHRAEAVPYSTPRGLTAAAERLTLNSAIRESVDKRKVSAWQTAAWQFFDQIGEVKFAFSLIGQIVSRVRIYPAYLQDGEQTPISVTEFLRRFDEDDDSTEHKTRKAMEAAQAVMDDLQQNALHSISSMLREAAINLSVPGEFYLVKHKGKWLIASGDELVQNGSGSSSTYKLKKDRVNQQGEDEIEKGAFVARIWRAHPRYSGEPDSSMLGVLDQCEQLVIIDQAMRIITRSRLNAGAVFIPEGVGASNLETVLSETATAPLEDEAALSSVVPLLLRGPAELGKEIKHIDFARKVDGDMLEQQSRALDRVLAGLDIPKDIVQGLSNARYSNAIVISDEMFRSHIEPLVLLIVDTFTQIYLRASMKKEGIDEELVQNFVVWYDPSDIVTRPDRSQAANDGFERKVLSGKAWRQARGFSETDAPDDEELIQRLALERATIPPEMGGPMIETLNPNFFKKLREENQEASEMPPDVKNIIDPGPGAPPEDGPQDDLGGGEISQGGFMPPPPTQ